MAKKVRVNGGTAVRLVCGPCLEAGVRRAGRGEFGLCNAHSKRFRKHGDVNVVKKWRVRSVGRPMTPEQLRLRAELAEVKAREDQEKLRITAEYRKSRG